MSSIPSFAKIRIYAFGSNGSGQLGIGHRLDVAVPSACQFHESSPSYHRELKLVVAGGNRTCLFFSDHSVMLAGGSDHGSIPEAFASVNYVFTALPPTEPIKLCAATWEAFTFAASSDRIYTSGEGSKGELGRGSDLTYSHTMEPLDLPSLIHGEVVVDLASGLNHTVAVLSDGQVIGWGQGRHGQLGEPAEVVWHPRKIQGIGFPVARAVCGRDFTYLVGPPDQGQHAILGSDKWNLRTLAPANVSGWKDIGAGWSSIFVLDSAGCLKSWGRNDHGQLAPADLPPIQKLAIGSEHALVLTTTGKVLAWGWGEHGNCGAIIDEDGDVKQGWVEVPVRMPDNGKIIGIGAGCATSWIWTHDEAEW